jgi:hypothetical protein
MQEVLYFNWVYRVFLLRNNSFGLPNIFRAQCRPSDEFKKVKFRLRTWEIWVDLNVHVLQIFQPQKFRKIFRWYSRYEKLSIAFLRLSIYPRIPELSISQEIGLIEFLHQPFIRGQTEFFIHKTHLAKYHGLLIYHTPGNVKFEPYWAPYAWVALTRQFLSVSYSFIKNLNNKYFIAWCQLLNALWILSIRDTQPELSALQWSRPMVKWHPLQSNVLDDKFRGEFNIILLDSEPPSEVLNEGLFENTPKLFWPCSRHQRTIKDNLLDREECQLQYNMYKKPYFGTNRSEMAPGNNTLNFEYNSVLWIHVFESR